MAPRKPRANKINTLHRFTVEGSGQFPFDMLRHDRCWPSSSTEVIGLAPHDRSTLYGDRRRVELHSHIEPKPDRWASFGWPVVEQHTLDVGS